MLAMGGSRSTIPRSSGCCCETRNSPTHCLPDTCSSRDGPLRLDDLAAEPLVVYPKSPRPSYADQVLSLLRERDLKPPAVYEVRELQTALGLGLVAAEVGVCLVPVSVEGLHRDNVAYRPLDDQPSGSFAHSALTRYLNCPLPTIIEHPLARASIDIVASSPRRRTQASRVLRAEVV